MQRQSTLCIQEELTSSRSARVHSDDVVELSTSARVHSDRQRRVAEEQIAKTGGADVIADPMGKGLVEKSWAFGPLQLDSLVISIAVRSLLPQAKKNYATFDAILESEVAAGVVEKSSAGVQVWATAIVSPWEVIPSEIAERRPPHALPVSTVQLLLDRGIPLNVLEPDAGLDMRSDTGLPPVAEDDRQTVAAELKDADSEKRPVKLKPQFTPYEVAAMSREVDERVEQLKIQ